VIQSGIQTGVAADGSGTSPVSFSPTFSSAPPVVCTVTSSSSTSSAISVQAIDVTTIGFSIYCTGGQPSTTVSVNWIANL
jgi:H-type lectin domain